MSTKPHRFDEFTEPEIQALVDSLESLKEGELGVSMLIACGPRAIPVLRKFLLEGRPRVIFQPRQRAVRALAEIGAKDVLLEYLSAPKDGLPPEIRYAEEAVESTAARLLSRWLTADVFQTLVTLLSRRVVVGAIETLGEFRSPEAVPMMIQLLGDDIARPFAAEAIQKVGSPAVAELVEAAVTPDPSRSDEAPSSIVRRRQALKLILNIGAFADSVSRVEPLMYDIDPEIAALSAQIVLQVGDLRGRLRAVEKLLDLYKDTNWVTQADIQTALLSALDIARPLIERRVENANNLNYSEAMLLRKLSSSLKSKMS